jgi:hypothetical protein
MRKTPRMLLTAALATGCAFDESGAGSVGVATLADEPGSADGDMHGVDEPLGTSDEAGDSADDRATTGGGAHGDDSAPDPDTSGAEVGESGADAGSFEGSGSGDTGSSVDGGAEPMCPIDVLELHWAEDGALEPPMELAVASAASGSPKVAISAQSEVGAVSFELDVPCAGQYTVFGLVWDVFPGAWGDPDPDSFYVGTGGGPELVWRYGCQTVGEIAALSWQSLEQLTAQPCGAAPVVLDVAEPGPVTLRFRNREAGAGSEVAGIAAIVIASDPLADPHELYSPY